MAKALCTSLTMVALGAPIYFHPAAHLWCGREWKGMDTLSQQRLPCEDFGSIILALIRGPVPDIASKIHRIDLSRVLTSGRRYFTTGAFRTQVSTIGDRILKIAAAMRKY